MAKKKKKRVGYGVKPPYIDFGEALNIVRRIYEEAGGGVTEDQLSSIIGNSVKSSSFNLKLATLKAFGLINQEGQGRRTVLSELGQGIAAATSPEERSRALKESFLRIENYSTLFDLWAGKILPTDEFFLNTLQTRCSIPSELTKQWKDSFMESGRAAGLFQERQDGKIQLRMEPNGFGAGLEEVGVQGRPQDPQPEKPPLLSKPGFGNVERFQIPLLEGRTGVIELPKGWTEGDVKKMIRVIAAMFTDQE